jgi:uncharacterized low-complexity protein
MDNKRLKPITAAVGTAFAASMSAAAFADVQDNPFGITELDAGYDLLAQAEGETEGKCGEGRCGEAGAGGDAEGKCGEGRCGEGEGKCGEGKCGEGQCGEGKCGDAA